MSFSVFDAFAFSIIMVSALLGMYRGLIKFSIDVTGFVLSIFVAFLIYPFAKMISSLYIESSVLVIILSVVLSYIITVLILSYCSDALVRKVAAISGGPVDRFLGLVAGGLRGLCICMIAFVLMVVFICGTYAPGKNLESMLTEADRNKYPLWLSDSKAVDYFEIIEDYLLSSMPKAFLKYPIVPLRDGSGEQESLDERFLSKDFGIKHNSGSDPDLRTINKDTEVSSKFENELKELLNEFGSKTQD
jgi:uncharacterized membrane protein required for colicin V production